MRYFAILLIALALTACAPALAPTNERAGDDVIVTLTASRAMFSVSVTILDATTLDPRCITIDAAAWCHLGDLERGYSTTIIATGPPPVTCTAAGYLEESRSLTSYRPFACRAVFASR